MSFQALKQARDARNQSDPLLNSKKQPQPTEPERIEERIESQVETSPPKDEIAKEDALAQVPDQSGSSNPVQSESQQILISENPNLIVKTSKQRGRSVFWDAKENCKKGTTLLKLRPEMTTLSSSLLRQRCTTCFRSAASIIPNQNQASPSAPTLQRCSACRIVRYCSSSCQAKDWKDHKNECKAFRSYGESARKTRKENGKPELREGDPLDEPGTSVRTLARLIWAKQREEKNWWSQVMTMQSHRTSLTAEQLQPMGQLSMELAYFLGAGEADDSSSRSEDQAKKLSDLGFSNAVELLDLVSIFSTNSFTAADSDLSPLGVSISSIASRFNHSCQPNAVIVWPRGPGGSSEPLHVVAIKDITPGEEVLTSYVDLSDPSRVRRQILKERYFFDCDCKGCVKGKKKLNPREVLWCEKRCGGWVRMPDLTASDSGEVTLKCVACGHPTVIDPSSLSDEIKAGEEALKVAEKLGSQGNDEASWKATAKSIHQLSSKLPPSAYPLLALMRSAQTSLISHASSLPINPTSTKYTTAQLLDEASKLGLVVVAGMQAGGDKSSIFTPGHPARALSIATAGKLLLADTEVGNSKANANASLPSLLSTPPNLPPPGPNRLQFGQMLLSQSLEELRIGFGKDGGEAGQSVRFALTELEREREMIIRAGGG